MSHESARDRDDDINADDRYEAEQVIGQGGMAIVQRARDRVTGRLVALKRLRGTPDAPPSRSAAMLFEREYLTLAQLRHPCIVEAFDYGIDSQGAYYAMELLSGGDLQALSPLPWQRACAIARDICSALALVHSRRLVYRDLSPRNVRCTSDGAAKLIDFGAMTPMGPSRELVGTMPFMAPEAVNQQPLDGRTDLYALGATLYFTLVQRHAYPARDMSQLRDLWRSRLRRPSEYIAEIPKALDELVMDLLQLEPAARPASAFEVIGRLSALAGLRGSDQLLIPQSYLSNPTLVGRAEAVAQARQAMLAAPRKRGTALLTRGASGTGRSRLLDAQVLEAKLAGLTVLRADGADALRGPYGVVRALFEQLFDVCGRAQLSLTSDEMAILSQVVDQAPSGSAVQSALVPAQVQQTLRKALLGVARRRPVMLAIDDLPRVDEHSAAFLALLAHNVDRHALVIATTWGDDDVVPSVSRGALDFLASHSHAISIENLSAPLTAELLSTLFGDVANLPMLAHYVHEVSGGNPRDIMRLAEHLVGEQQVRYQAGAWFIPARFESSSLPTNMADALSMRVASLTYEARALALAFAQEPKQTFSFEDCYSLAASPREDAAALLQALDELVAAQILTNAGTQYTLKQTNWKRALEAACPAEQREAAHRKLARLFEARGDGFRTAEHLFEAGEDERGLDVLIEHAIASEKISDANAGAFYEMLGALPPHWLSVYERALALCQERKRPARHHDALLSRLAGLVAFAVSERDGFKHIEARVARLKREAGLEDFATLPSTLDFGTRLRTALGVAGARFQETPEHDRVGDPGWAIQQIVKSTLAGLGAVTFTLDYAACRRLPSLAPLVPLSPAVQVVEMLVSGLAARLVGRIEEAIKIYHALLDRMGQPDRAGLTDVHHMTTRIRIVQGLGMIDAAMGRDSCLDYAAQVEAEPLYALQGMFIRHIHLVWQGDVDGADRYKRKIDVARLESSARHGFEGQHLLSELVAYALADDMTRVKRATDAVEPRARIHRAWEPVLSFGRGEYHRIRGDYEAALTEHERGLSLIERGESQIWIYTAGAHVRTLLALGRHELACERGREYLKLAETNGLGYLQTHVRLPLSLALAAAGAHGEAVAMADRMIDELTALQANGLLIACVYEARAQIARMLENEEDCARFLALAETHSPARAKRRRAAHSKDAPLTASALLDELSALSQFASVIEKCHSVRQRAELGIDFLVRQSNASAGALYALVHGSLERVAVYGDLEEFEAQADAVAASHLDSELAVGDATGDFSTEAPVERTAERSVRFEPQLIPVLVSHHVQGRMAITGVALLLAVPGRSFSYPARMVTELSQSLAADSDVVPALL